MFIDIHVHVRRVPGPPRNGKPAYATPDQLIARYDALGIEKGILLPELNPECSYGPQSNEDIIEIARAYPNRFVPFCNIDPRSMTNSCDAPLTDLLRYYKEQGCKGIGEICANLPFQDPLVQNLFKHVQEIGFPLTFHISPELGRNYGLYDEPGLPQFTRCLEKFPHLKFLAHSQSFWAEMAPLEKPSDRWGYPSYPVRKEGVVPRLFRRYPNLLGDLSAGSGCNALKRDPEYAAQFMNEFQDRLFFGTDICAPDSDTPLVDFMLELRHTGKLSEEVFRKIASENAIRLLNLS